ncbi:MAG: hypothetical protein FJ215_00585 [Ignavibacteria bacterium]|nr:hypothetical protein [Ignavibacteria bacterium]
MPDFWNDIINPHVRNENYKGTWEELQHNASFRPTIYIVLGGFGCMVVRALKKSINDLIPVPQIRDGFAFIALDTHSRETTDILTPVEYIEMIGIHPDTVASNPRNAKSLGWYKKLAGKWSAKTISGGVDMTKPLGRIAFLFPPTLTKFLASLNSAYTTVNRFKQNFGARANTKVYLISSLAGGTGSGMFADACIVTKKFLSDNVGVNYLFQSIVVTPEVLQDEAQDIKFPDFYANVYASLKEIFHFIRGNKETVTYGMPGYENVMVSQDFMPDPLFLVTDRNDKVIFDKMKDIADSVVQYLMFEIQSPLETSEGQPKVQDKENPQQSNFGIDDMPKFLSSIGTVRFGLPMEKLVELYALRIIDHALDKELLDSVGQSEVDQWIDQHHLSEAKADQLQGAIRKNKEGNPMRIAIDVVGEIGDKKRTELIKACSDLKAKKLLSVSEQYKPIMEKNSSVLLELAKKGLELRFHEILKGQSVGAAVDFLERLSNEVSAHRKALEQEFHRDKERLVKADHKLSQSAGAVGMAAKSFIVGRGGKIKAALGSFDGDLEAYLNQQVVVWSQEIGIQVYEKLSSYLKGFHGRWVKVQDSLRGRSAFVRNSAVATGLEIDSLSDISKRGAGNRFSLVDKERAKVLYDQYIPSDLEKAIAERARHLWRETEMITDTSSSDEMWVAKVKGAINDEIQSKLLGVNILTVINHFYSEQQKKDSLFTSLVSLANALFPLDSSKQEGAYETSWITAVHQSIRQDFQQLFGNYKPKGDGMMHAYFPNAFEVVLYCIRHGYTAHSLTRLQTYKANYDMLQARYEQAFSEGIAHRPIHCWTDASKWEELVPRPKGEDEAFELFALGRALSYLYPTDEKRNEAYIYNRGNVYFIQTGAGEEKIKIGTGIEEAVENFTVQPEWRERVRNLVEARISEKRSEVRSRLISDFEPVLRREIEISSKVPTKGKEKRRVEVLRALYNSLFAVVDQKVEIAVLELRERI